ILERSAVGATVDTARVLPLLAARAHYAGDDSRFEQDIVGARALQCVLSGGDDYELVFTAPPGQRAAVQAASTASATTVTRIGQIDAAAGLRLVDAHGAPVSGSYAAFDHFA
ncbi:MAG: thiamine-phosphate kinase, partial [Rhodoferax sp.]